MLLGRILSAVLVLALPAATHAETLKLLNWEAYLSEEVLSQWQTQSNSNIEVIEFDNDASRDVILLNSDHHEIDISVVDEIVAERFGKAGKFIEITENNIPSVKHIGSFWRNRCSKYAVPYLWGTLGIVYRSDVVTTPPRSWKEILQPADYLKGHIAMLNDYTDLIAPALFQQGYPLNTDNSAALKEAFEILKAQTPHVLTYEYPITYLQSSEKADQLYMAVAYGGDQFTMNEILGKEGLWKYAIPEEGTVLWVDCLAVSANSKHLPKALEFINFLNQPEIAALNAENLYYATPNETALPYLSDKFRNDAGVFPEVEVLKKSGLYEVLSNTNIKQRIRISNAIVNIHESQQTR